jgi:sensor histidine kinase YesM
MIWTGIEMVATLFEISLFIFFVSSVLDFNASFNKYIPIIGLSLFTLVANSLHILGNINVIAMIVIGIILTFIYSESKWYSKIFTVIIYFLILILIDASVILIFSKLISVSVNSILEYGYSRAICILVSKTILFVTCIIVTKHTSFKNIKIELTYYIPIIFITLSCFVISATIMGNFFETGMSADPDSLVLLLLGYIVISLITIYIYDRSIRNSEDKLKLELLNNQLSYQESNITEIKENHIEIRKIWHDVYNHLNNIALLLKNHNVDECVEFIENYTQTINEINIKINSGNIFVDALISRKSFECANNSIEFSSDILLLNEIKINNIDLCILIGNALDNAIEASVRLDLVDRKIKVQIKMLNDYILINITNTVSENALLKNSNLDTIKSDKKRHGFGMINMNSIVKKYDGELKLSCEKNEFVFNAILKNSPIIQ